MARMARERQRQPEHYMQQNSRAAAARATNFQARALASLKEA